MVEKVKEKGTARNKNRRNIETVEERWQKGSRNVRVRKKGMREDSGEPKRASEKKKQKEKEVRKKVVEKEEENEDLPGIGLGPHLSICERGP